jgi:hypothetical protein
MVQSARPLLLYNIFCDLLRTHNWANFDFGLEIGTSSNKWAQLMYVLNKNRTMDNVEKHSNCLHIPSSQTFRSQFLFLHLKLSFGR